MKPLLKICEAYTKEHKKDIDAQILYGYLLFTKAVFSATPEEIFSFYKQSQKVLKRAVKLDKQHWRANMTLATLYKHAPGEMNLTDDALDILEEVITRIKSKAHCKEQYAQAYKDLSYVYEQLGQYDEAITARRRGLKMFPDEPYFQEP